MKPGLTGSSSDDLTRARRLAEKLAPEPPAPPPAAGGEYVRFQAAKVTPTAVASLPSDPGPRHARPLEINEAEPRGRLWDKLLRWSVETTGAEGALIVDERGMLVAVSETISESQAELLGGHLSQAIETAGRMSGGTESTCVAIQVGTKLLTGFPVELGEGNHVTFALLGPTMVAAEARQLVASAARRVA